ncbi:MAG: MG2 domain-containing protein [Candidatus Gracilibacteria bacterium]
MNLSLFKKTSSLLLILTLLISSFGQDFINTINAQDDCIFTDVCDAGDVNYPAIKYLKEKQLIKGNPDGSFRPDDSINRAEAMTLAFRGFGGEIKYDTAHSFSDLKAEDWFSPYVSTAKKEGFVQGYPDGTFKAGQPVKYEEAAKIFLKFYKVSLPKVLSQDNPSAYPFFGYASADAGRFPYPLDEWYSPYIQVIEHFNLLDLYSVRDQYPEAPDVFGSAMPRKQVAMLLYNTIKAKDRINSSLSILSSWESYEGNVVNKSDLYFYFDKPVQLSDAKSFIELTQNGKKITDYNLYSTRWSYGNDRINIGEYPYNTFEVRIDSKTFSETGPVSITFKKGLKSTYGSSLTTDKTYTFTFSNQASRLQIEGQSYFMTGSKITNTVTQTNLSKLTGTVCKLNTSNFINSFIQGDTNSNRGTHEFMYLNEDPANNPQLKKECSNFKSQSFPVSAGESTKEIDLEAIYGQPMTPGLYYAAFSAPEVLKYRGNLRTHRFIYVSDTSLTLKTDPTGLASVWAFHLKTAKPQENLQVSLYEINREGNDRKLIQKSNTDKNGKAQFTIKPSLYETNEYIFVADAENHFGLVSSLWDKGIEPYQYGLDTYSGYWEHDPRNDYTIYMHTDRKIYRPEHTVEIKGIVRKNTPNGYILPSLSNVNVTVTDAVDHEIFSKTVALNAQGSFTTNLILDKNASLGGYTITARTSSPIEDEYFGNPTATFQVEDYRKPEFKVDYAVNDNYTNGEILSTEIQASYYFGTNVSGGEATIQISKESLYMYADTDEWYNFFDTYACYFYCKDSNIGIEEQKVQLDANGKGAFILPLYLDSETTSGLYTMIVTVQDKAGREVSNTQTFKVHKTDSYAGIRSTGYLVEPNKNAEFEILTIDTEGKPLGNKKVEVEFYNEDWTSYQKTDVSGDSVTNSENINSKLSSTSVTTDASGKAKVTFTPTKAGSYYARTVYTDSKGNRGSSRDYIYVYALDNSYTPWASTDIFKVQTVLDKPTYKVGDTAKLIIQSPFEKSTALITIEREKILESMIVELPNNNTPVSFPIKSSYLPNAFVSVTLLSATGTPDFRQGYTKLYVDTSVKELSINLSTDKKTYQPREKVTVNVSTKDSTGKSIPAEVSLAVVDEAVIALAGGVDRDIMNAFYYFKGIVVSTAQSLTHLVEKISLETVGGSGKGGASGLPIKRGNMKDTAFWSGTVQTDAAGNAQVSFTLPDNLTHWEILSIGTTSDTKVGSAAVSIESKIDFVAQALLPRFVRSGDQAVFSYSLFNLTNQDQTVSATLDIPGIDIKDKSKSILVKAQGSSPVSWAITAPLNAKNISLDMKAISTTGVGDHVTDRLNVYPAQVVDTFGQSGQGTGNFSTTLTSGKLSAEALATGDLTIYASGGLTANLKKQLQYLLMYPYGCSEQTTSVLFSNVILKEYLEKSNLELEGISSEDIEKNVSMAFQKLYNYQSDNGGWSLWGDEEYVENYLTAYVLSGLSYAEQNGFSVDVNVVKKGRDYLLNQLSSGKMANLNERAFALSVLKNLGVKGISSYADVLYKNKDNLSIESQSYLMSIYFDLARETTNAQEKSVYTSRTTALKDGLLSKMAKEAGKAYIKVDPKTDYFGFMYGNVAMNATLLRSLAYVDSNNTVLPNMISYLVSQSKDDRWATTHETSATLRGISEYLQTHAENNDPFKAEILVNGTNVATADFAQGGNSDATVVHLPLKNLTSPLTISIQTPQGRTVYYQAFVNYQKSPKEQYVENENFIIKRTLEYYKTNGSLTSSPTTLHRGDKVRINISFIPKYKDNGNNKRIAIEDHLPAGLEALNPGITTSGKTDASFSIGWADHIEMKDQLVMLYMQDARETQFSYDAQVISEGTFSYPAVHAFEMYNPAVYAKSGATALRTER